MKRNFKLIACGLLLISALASCKVYPPVYKRVENFRMERLDKDGFKIKGDVVLYNPNKLRVKLQDVLMNVELNDKHVATAGQKEPVQIRSQSEFSVPLDLVIKPDMTFKEGLQNIFSMIKTKEVDVKIKGVIVLKAFGIKVSIPIEQKEKVDLTRLK